MMGNIAKRQLFAASLCAAALVATPHNYARADAVSDFYANRTIEISVGAGAGGGYDVNARLLARHFGRFVPGAPSVIVNNMPGGGGITATNYLFNVAPKNGLAIATFSNAMLTLPLFGEAAKYDPARFSWVGSTSREDGVCIASKASGVRKWEDLRGKRLVVGTTAPGTTTHLFPTVLSRMFNIDFKFVTGYADGGQVVLALERGEIDALCQTYSSLKISHPLWISSGVVQPFVFIGLGSNAELPGLPSIMDLTSNDEQRKILTILLAPTAAGRPFTAPPDIPAERLTALRNAFSVMVKDPAFLADAQKTRVDVSPMEGAEVNALLAKIYATPRSLVDKMRAIVSEGAAR